MKRSGPQLSPASFRLRFKYLNATDVVVFRMVPWGAMVSLAATAAPACIDQGTSVDNAVDAASTATARRQSQIGFPTSGDGRPNGAETAHYFLRRLAAVR